MKKLSAIIVCMIFCSILHAQENNRNEVIDAGKYRVNIIPIDLSGSSNLTYEIEAQSEGGLDKIGIRIDPAKMNRFRGALDKLMKEYENLSDNDLFHTHTAALPKVDVYIYGSNEWVVKPRLRMQGKFVDDDGHISLVLETDPFSLNSCVEQHAAQLWFDSPEELRIFSDAIRRQ